MTSISAVNQNNQQNYATSEKKESASIFNNPQATESTTTQDASLAEIRRKQVREEAEKLIKEWAKSYGISEERICKYIESTVGYKKEDILELDAYKQTELCSFIENTLEQLFNAKDKEAELNEIEKDVKKLVANENSIKQISEFFENYRNYSLLDILKRQLGGIEWTITYSHDGKQETESRYVISDEGLRNKLNRAESLNEFSDQEFKVLMSAFIYRSADNLDSLGGVKLLTSILDVTLKDENFENRSSEESMLATALGEEKGKLYSRLYDAFKDYNALTQEKDSAMEAFLERCKGNREQLYAFLDNKKIGDMFKNFEPQKFRELITALQLSLSENNGIPDQLLVNKIREYINPIREKASLALAKSEEERTPDENAIIEYYNSIKNNINVGNAHILIFGTEETAASQVQSIQNFDLKDEKEGTYSQVYATSLSLPEESGLNPIDITERLNRITNNDYSQVLTDLGYELPTSENLEELRAKAAEGTLLPDNNETSTSSGVGYTQSSRVDIDNAYLNVYNLHSSIVGNTEEEPTYTVEAPADKKLPQSTSFNRTNLSNYTGSELSEMIANGLMKFSDAVKQYSNHLSESGKKFVVQSIKAMDEGRQVFALNSTSNTARWEIMKKANLLGEDLDVDFDYNHEKLREKYQA